MPDRSALIIANDKYDDPGLRQLVCPPSDADALAKILGNEQIGDFDVVILLNESSHKVLRVINSFFRDRKREDLLLLYFAGHGIKDEHGQLYLATKNTDRQLLLSTAIPTSLINDLMDRSRSRRQVLLLDCCYSGAFARGMIPRGGENVNTGEHLGGRGRFVITASDAMQYAFEEDKVSKVGKLSYFTRSLVQGLETGDADKDGDGKVSIDELYDYINERLTEEMPGQRPEKWALGVQGEIIIAKNPFVKPVALPKDILQKIDNYDPRIREIAVADLGRLLRSDNKGLALAARSALEELVKDDSRKVSCAAEKLLRDKAESLEPKEEKRPIIEEEKLIKEEEPLIKAIEPKPVRKPEEPKKAFWTAKKLVIASLASVVFIVAIIVGITISIDLIRDSYYSGYYTERSEEEDIEPREQPSLGEQPEPREIPESRAQTPIRELAPRREQPLPREEAPRRDIPENPVTIPLRESGFGSATGYIHGMESSYYSFEIRQPGPYTILTVSQIDTYGELLNRNGYVIERNDDNGIGSNFKIDREMEPGRYYLGVRGYSEQTSGEFEIRIIRIIILNNLGHGEESGHAQGRNPNIYCFEIRQPGLYVIFTESQTDTVGWLHDNNFEELISDDDSGQNRNFSITRELEPGRYYVSVAGYNEDTSGEFRVVIRRRSE